jgi:hypothetical protein
MNKSASIKGESITDYWGSLMNKEEKTGGCDEDSRSYRVAVFGLRGWLEPRNRDLMTTDPSGEGIQLAGSTFRSSRPRRGIPWIVPTYASPASGQ